MLTAPHISKNQSILWIEIIDDMTGELIWTSKEDSKNKQVTFADDWEQMRTHFLAQPEKLVLTGGLM
jgi:hypothetical protein